MKACKQSSRYNQPNRQMRSRSETVVRLSGLTCFFLATLFLPGSLLASNLGDAARELGHKIGVVTGPGTFALEVRNKSSLDDKSVRDIRSALEAQLRVEGIRTSPAEQGKGSVLVTLSESVREYVWAAEITIGTEEKKVALVSLARAQSNAVSVVVPLVLRSATLFAQEQPILDAALVDTSAGSRLLVLGESNVGVFHQQAGRWEQEAALAIARSRIFPRDPRGRLLLRRDHLFDVYLPGTLCRSSAAAPLTLACIASDEPWPLAPDDNGVRAFFAPERNFFTGTLSPGIGKLSTVPSFYSAAPLPRSNYALWVMTAVDGSVHLIDGFTDQALRGVRWGSDVAAVRSGCGTGAQVLVADAAGDRARDSLRALEFPERDPVAVSSAVEFDGRIVALWAETNGNSAMAVVKREDTGWYEANRVSVNCGN
jgi:hypothetical protein